MKKLSNKGQALIEYILIVALITVIAISIVKMFGGYLKDSITKSSCSIVDKVYVEGSSPGEGTCSSELNVE
ncbi:MAG: hypothetical protein PHQ89_00510 [Bacilli bacterium]|nr:hypothetical protein [Bacilli bacterium]